MCWLAIVLAKSSAGNALVREMLSDAGRERFFDGKKQHDAVTNVPEAS